VNNSGAHSEQALSKSFIAVGFKVNIIDAHFVWEYRLFVLELYSEKMAAALTNVGYALKVLQRQPDSSWKIQSAIEVAAGTSRRLRVGHPRNLPL
jgi:hypothetical protein